MQVQFVRKSSNAKIGTIPCTTSERKTCPDACPMKGKTSCYAEGGYYTRMNWDKVDSGERGAPYDALLASVAKLPANTLWRHNVAGDLVGEDNKVDTEALMALADANKGRKGFTYTHYPILAGAERETLQNNMLAVWDANQKGFTVNVSANSPSMAEAIRSKYDLPTVTLVPNEAWWKGSHKRGSVVRCPAETSDTITCKTCQLCQHSERSVIVGFTAHGAGKKQAELIASA